MRSSLLRLMLLVVALFATSSGILCEVSVEMDPSGTSGFIIMGRGGGDGGSPWPWRSERSPDPNQQLNAEGDLNGDGPPAFAIDPETGFPTVVWAWHDGQDYEIALARWTGEQWSIWQILTDNHQDDLDPSVTIGKAGQTSVSWWRPGGLDQVFNRDGNPSEESWSPEMLVTTELGRGQRPGTTRHQQDLVVGYQSEVGDSGLRMVIVVRMQEQRIRDLVASTFFAGPAGDGDIDVQVHARCSTLWADWVDDDGVLGWTVYDRATGDWSLTNYEPYSWTPEDGEPIAREMARVRIRMLVN